jgi:glycosyltransferase involved in cell wall biosynthesis
MRIGIVPFLDPHGGGTFQHSQNVLEAASRWRQDDNDVVLFLRDLAERRWLRGDWVVYPLRTAHRNLLRRLAGPSVRRLWRRLHPAPPAPRVPADLRDDPSSRQRLREVGIELMLFPTLDPLSFEAGLPYVLTVHDLQFRLQPEWAEFAGSHAWWDYLVRFGARWATLLLVDSEIGREDVLALYGDEIGPERIRVLPYLPAQSLPRMIAPAAIEATRAKFDLPARYLFYPAQFWPAKNHARLVEALAALGDAGRPGVDLVLCGSRSGHLREETYRKLRALARSLGVDRRIHCLGYISDADLAALYAGAVALVMPTFFGPTNIPVVEAWSLGCPVLTSDIRGVREQVGDAALLVDPRDVESIAAGIGRLWRDEELRRELARAGSARLAAYTASDFANRLREILDEAMRLVREGKAPRRA